MRTTRHAETIELIPRQRRRRRRSVAKKLSLWARRLNPALSCRWWPANRTCRPTRCSRGARSIAGGSRDRRSSWCRARLGLQSNSESPPQKVRTQVPEPGRKVFPYLRSPERLMIGRVCDPSCRLEECAYRLGIRWCKRRVQPLKQGAPGCFRAQCQCVAFRQHLSAQILGCWTCLNPYDQEGASEKA